MGIPTIVKAGATEYQKFCIGHESRARRFVMAATAVVAVLMVLGGAVYLVLTS